MKIVEQYGNLPGLTDKIRKSRMRLDGHNVRHPELAASGLVLWEPAHDSRNAGGRRPTYIYRLKRDTGLTETAEVKTLMEDRQRRRAAVHDSPVGVG